jgi:hypothetical protein
MVGDDSISGTNSSEFTTDSACDGETVGPGDPCTIQVTFEPTTAGMKSAMLNIPNNGSNPNVIVNLSGTGVTSSLTLSPTAFDFGSVAPGMQSAAQTFTATSTGTASAAVTGPTLGGTNPDEFQLTPVSPMSYPAFIAPSNTATVEVRFAPTSFGAKTATLIFESNDPDSPDTAALSGTTPAAPLTPLTPVTPIAPKRCKKGFKRKHGKCVRKKKKKKK